MFFPVSVDNFRLILMGFFSSFQDVLQAVPRHCPHRGLDRPALHHEQALPPAVPLRGTSGAAAGAAGGGHGGGQVSELPNKV